MYRTIDISLNERVVLMRHGLPVRALGPGRHRVWGFGLTPRFLRTDAVLFDVEPAILGALPADWYTEVTIGDLERGVLYQNGRPVQFLRPGIYRHWTVDSRVRVAVLSVDEPVPPLTDELIRVIPTGELVYVTVRAHERGLEYVKGELVRVLEPGRHVRWSHPEREVTIQVVDVRSQQLALVGQELMTRDKVTLRLSIHVEWAIEDPRLAALTVSDPRDTVYLLVQLAARQYVAGVTLDELLEGRDAMTRFLEEHSVGRAKRFGARIDRVGVKDVVLPGEMKALLNRVIEAEKEAAANVILRREEAAATRSMANAAKLMADQPALMRLKELETVEKVAERIQELRLVVGGDGVQKLLNV